MIESPWKSPNIERGTDPGVAVGGRCEPNEFPSARTTLLGNASGAA